VAWSLADVIGQEANVARLNREMATGRLAHAYMFEGREGTGKLTLVHGLVGRLFCQRPAANGDACQTCRPCLMLAHGEHPDYLELSREPAELLIGRFLERSGAARETVDHQPLLPFLRLKPVEGGRRIAVIPDAERMRAEAANAFLKTLEEPPGQTLILLTVGARDRLPATITSRCRRLGVRPLSEAAIAGELEKRGVASGDDARELAVTAEGSLGAALALASGETLEFWRWLDSQAFASPGAAAAQDLAEAMIAYGGASGDHAGKRRNARAALDLAATALRRRLRGGGDPDGTAKALGVLWTAAEQVGRNVRPDLVLLSAAFEVMSALR
jgi:DNA polymerase-3 subunit delta'